MLHISSNVINVSPPLGDGLLLRVFICAASACESVGSNECENTNKLRPFKWPHIAAETTGGLIADQSA